jgi:hypothetical protein
MGLTVTIKGVGAFYAPFKTTRSIQLDMVVAMPKHVYRLK